MQPTSPPYLEPEEPESEAEPAAPSPSGSSGRQRTTRSDWMVMFAMAVLAGVLAALTSPAAPTKWAPADAFWVATTVAVVTLCASRARRWTLLWMAVPAAALGVGAARVAGVLALVGALVLVVKRTRDRRARTAVGALAAVGLLGMALPASVDVVGLTSAIAVVAALPAVWSAIGRSRQSERRAARWVLAVLFLICAVGSVFAGLVVALTAPGAIDALDASTNAASEASDADTQAAAERFRVAAAEFESLSDTAGKPWFLPARAVPVVGANINLVRTVYSVGAELNATAATLVADVDQSALTRPDGGIDLAVLQSWAVPAQQAADAITVSQAELATASSPWILPPIETQLVDVADSLDDAESSATNAARAAEVLPALLGVDGPARYLLLLGNPAELRDIGGHVGNWAELVVDDGDIDLVEVGKPYDLFRPGQAVQPTIQGAYPESFIDLRPGEFPQNWGSSPDVDTVARLAAELYPQARPGLPLTGVVYADPAAFAALLEFTGSVEVPTTDVVLTSDNAEEFLTRGQFSILADNNETGSGDPLGDAIETAIRRLVDGPLPEPGRLLERFGEVVEAGHLQVTTFEPEPNDLLSSTGLRRTMERRDQEDLLSVVNRNANPSKIDAFLRRSVSYDVRWQPETGLVKSTVTIRLTNEAPATGLAPIQSKGPGDTPERTNRTQLSILTPLTAANAQRDGDPAPFATQTETATIKRHSFFLDLPPGQTTEIRLDLFGIVDAGTYQLRWIGQPLLLGEPTEVRVATSGGPGARRVTEVLPASSDQTIRVEPDGRVIAP